MADVGKVYPSEVHLLRKEIEVQGELISQERMERKAEIDELRLQLDALRRAIEETHSGFLRRYEASYARERQAWNPELQRAQSSGA